MNPNLLNNTFIVELGEADRTSHGSAVHVFTSLLPADCRLGNIPEGEPALDKIEYWEFSMQQALGKFIGHTLYTTSFDLTFAAPVVESSAKLSIAEYLVSVGRLDLLTQNSSTLEFQRQTRDAQVTLALVSATIHLLNKIPEYQSPSNNPKL